jgi:hypothetical protein
MPNRVTLDTLAKQIRDHKILVSVNRWGFPGNLEFNYSVAPGMIDGAVFLNMGFEGPRRIAGFRLHIETRDVQWTTQADWFPDDDLEYGEPARAVTPTAGWNDDPFSLERATPCCQPNY